MRLFAAVLAFSALAAGQVAQQANDSYQTPQGRAGMIQVLSGPGRAAQIQPEGILKVLQLKPGMSVADIGSGAGVMLPYLSKAVGDAGTVVAEDIFDDFLAKARDTAKTAGLTNVSFVKGTEKDPALRPGLLDVALTIDSYHHFDYPADVLSGIHKSLKPGGRFAVVEYYRRPGAMGPDRDPLQHIRLDKDDMIREVESNGFKLLESSDLVAGKQYIAVFSLAK
jgi:predicted methyltransferase